MKKLFSLPHEGLFSVEQEGQIYCMEKYNIYTCKTEFRRYYDQYGCLLPDYSPEPWDGEYELSDDWEEEEDEDRLWYNSYGVACAQGCLVDEKGCVIPDTQLNLDESCYPENRYFVIGLLTEKQRQSINQCGTAEGIVLNYYDTKTREYILRDIPECRLDVSFFDGEPEVVLAAAELLGDYDDIGVCNKGTILARKEGWITVYDYYQ